MDNIVFPHIRYIWEPNSKSTEMYYLGGENEDNDKRLTIGNRYRVSQSFYAENEDQKRVKVWVCNDDEDKGKLCRINRKNFSIKPIDQLRDSKLEKILKK